MGNEADAVAQSYEYCHLKLDVQISYFMLFVLFVYIPRTGTAGSYSISIFNLSEGPPYQFPWRLY